MLKNHQYVLRDIFRGMGQFLNASIGINLHVILLIAFAGFWNAKMDDCQFHNPECRDNWKAKWELTETGNLISLNKAPWYYFKLHQPKYKEAFPFSSTALVAFTDDWHRYQFFFLTCFVLAIVSFRKAWYWVGNLYWFIGLRILFGLSFEFFF